MAETYQALYRKWRPLTFEDVVGQEHVSQTLRHSVQSGHIGHAYLFCGTRGTGKTSTAKIFSRAVNCENPHDGDPCNECPTCRGILDGSILDVYEMDAASNSGVNNIREIRDEVIYTPSASRYKVYIIDEAHMLTTEAFNALLKTLEEPPGHIVFILATTEPHKIPQTILSRCQRYDFRRIGVDDIAKRISKITKAEGIGITPDAEELIAELADGSMRDGLSILEQCAAYGKEELCRADVAEIVGIVDISVLFDISAAVLAEDTAKTLELAGGFLEQGKEVLSFLEDFINHYRFLLLCKASEKPAALLEKTEEATEKYVTQAKDYSMERILYSITTLSEYLAQAKWMSNPQIAIDMALVRLCSPKYSGENAALLARLEALERKVASLELAPPAHTANSAVQIQNLPSEQEEKTEESPPWNTETEIKPESKVKPDMTIQPKETPRAKMPAQTTSAENGGTAWGLWSEALATVKAESKSLYMFLFKAKVLDKNDVIEIVLDQKFAYERIAKPEGIKYLSALFTRVAGKTVTAHVVMDGEQTAAQESIDPQPNVASIMDIVSKKELLGDKMTIIGEENEE